MRQRKATGRIGTKTGRSLVAFARRWFYLAAFVFGWKAYALAQDAKPIERPKAAPAKPTVAHRPANAAASGQNAPEQAVVFDETYRPAAKDLLLTLEGDRKADAAAHYLRGIMLEETADTDQAFAEYLKALTLDPANIDLSIKLAWKYAAQGNSADAIGLLKDSIKALPKQADPYLALSYLYFKVLSKYDLAQKYATQALDIDPSNILVYQYLKEVYTSTNQMQKIGPLLERAAKIEQKAPAYWLRLGALYVDFYLRSDARKGADSGALSANPKPDPAKNPDLTKKTSAIYQKALALADNDPDVVSQVADYYVDTAQYLEAAPLYERSIAAEPSQIQARENLARCYLATEQRDKAIAALEGLIQVNPAQGHAYEFLGKLYEDAKDYDKAAASYEQSLLISPNQKENYDRLAQLLLEKAKKPEKAVAVLTEARRRFPDLPWFSYLLAAALGETKQYQQSLTLWEQTLLDAQNSRPDLLSSEFYFGYGRTAEQAGLYDKAAPLLKKALEMADDPKNKAVMANYLGYMYVDHNMNLEEGGALIQQALEIDPDSGAYRDSLGWYYYKTNQFDKAVVELTRAAELIRDSEPLKKDDPVVLEHIGDTYSKLKDTVNAVAYWQKAVGLDPENPTNGELTKKIEASKAQLTQGPPPAEAAAAPDKKR